MLNAVTADELISTDLAGDEAVSMAWSTDGATVLVGGLEGRLHVLDAGTLGRRSPARIVSPGWVKDVAISPSGDLAASLGTDGDLVLWDTSTWQPLGRPVSDATAWGWLSYDEDTRVLHSWSETGQLLDVSTDLDAWSQAACVSANRELTDEEVTLYLRDAAGQGAGACSATPRVQR